MLEKFGDYDALKKAEGVDVKTPLLKSEQSYYVKEYIQTLPTKFHEIASWNKEELDYYNTRCFDISGVTNRRDFYNTLVEQVKESKYMNELWPVVENYEDFAEMMSGISTRTFALAFDTYLKANAEYDKGSYNHRLN